MEAITLIAAVAALVVAVAAVGLVLRSERRATDFDPSAARAGQAERRLAQLSQRLEVVEAEVDSQRSDGTAEAGVATRPPPRGTAAISRIGLIRFDAFEDGGGAQSFALALVDEDGDGIVLTSLHSRPTTRIYIKAIRRGVADAPLSGEETRALQDAGITPTV